MISALILPLAYGYEVVSHQLRSGMPSSCIHYSPRSAISSIVPFHRSMCTLHSSTFRYTDWTSSTSLNVCVKYMDHPFTRVGSLSGIGDHDDIRFVMIKLCSIMVLRRQVLSCIEGRQHARQFPFVLALHDRISVAEFVESIFTSPPNYLVIHGRHIL